MADQTGSLQDKQALFEQSCRMAGLKITYQRLELYRELLSTDDHPSAESIYQRLRKTLLTLSLDTVYRTLTTLEEHNLISRFQTVESQARFEANMKQHHHVICSQCGEITDFQWNFFDTVQLPDEVSDWGRIESKQVTFHGICRQCAKAANNE